MISCPRHEPMTKFCVFFFFSEVARAPVIGWYWMVQIGHCSFGAKTSYLGVGFGFDRFCGPSGKIQKWFFPLSNFAGYGSLGAVQNRKKSFPRWFQKHLRVCYQICQFFRVFSPILSEDLVDVEARAVLRTIPSCPIEPNFKLLLEGKEWRFFVVFVFHMGPFSWSRF